MRSKRFKYLSSSNPKARQASFRARASTHGRTTSSSNSIFNRPCLISSNRFRVYSSSSHGMSSSSPRKRAFFSMFVWILLFALNQTTINEIIADVKTNHFVKVVALALKMKAAAVEFSAVSMP